MKCPHCGTPLGLEDAFCPFCGQPNTLAKKHQEDMKHYKNEFKKTQQEVYTKTNRFASLTVPIIILFVLLLLNIGAVVFVSKSWDIGRSMLESKISKNVSSHEKNLKDFEEAEDYYGLSNYYNSNSLYLSDDFKAYSAVIQTADSYASIYRILANISDSYHFQDENISSTVNSIVLNLDYIFNVEQTFAYRKETHLTEEKMAVIAKIRTQTNAILVSYGHLTKEEAEELPNLSASRQKELLEGRLAELS